MPKRNDISSILVIGAGPIVIGQGCEFDYSGTQACKALKEEGFKVILVNSNPASIMTDSETADTVYIEPLTLEVLEKIIATERPDAILSTVGGQTALNCGVDLWRQGILEKYGVVIIGAHPEAIEKAENRELFNQAMERIGLEVPRNAVVSSYEQALKEIKKIGLPAVIRPSFTLGGSGGGVAETMEEFKEIVRYGLDLSPTHQVLIDESIVGWKEFELEVVRDKKDNAIVVCSVENIDPMGVHTGDSITVAPALTLTDKEFQTMRNSSLAVLREIGVETGGSNVQFAVNPKDGRQVVIEMNPRVSRSSALASKATGYPIAKIAAKLAVGHTLDEIKNDITKITPASFEPTLDYIVTKIPRFNFEKFSESRPVLSTSMRSVGEVMSIGRSFAESFQKALCSLEQGLNGLNSPHVNGLKEAKNEKERREILSKALTPATPDRILVVAEGMRQGLSEEKINEITGIDLWFLREIKKIVMAEKDIQKNGLPQNPIELLSYKKMGFSDARLAELTGLKEAKVRELRHRFDLRPVYKTVDTCAAENEIMGLRHHLADINLPGFDSLTPFLYSCYEGDGFSPPECESFPRNQKKVIILGSGPNRIGQGIEFDYTCVHGAKSLSLLGYETIMVNCNPETVSTDYDVPHKLYFEPLSYEFVSELIHCEQQNGELVGVIVQLGGQTPLKLSQLLKSAGIPIIGTSPDSIDLTEDRERFQKLVKKLGLRQPKNSICHRIEDISSTIRDKVGYPVIVRPSHVLGGRAMAILETEKDLGHYLDQHAHASLQGPLLIDRFLEDAVEVDVDAIYDGQDIYIAGIMEHIERAGIHSGDSACVLPPFSLSPKMSQEITESTTILAKAINILGPMNIQYAVKDEQLFLIEVNPRASRSTPFVSKATGVPMAMVASQVMLGRPLSHFNLPQSPPPYYSVKESVFPFARFPNSDILLGPEMKSTGEVMGQDQSLPAAFAKAQLAAMNGLPKKGMVLVNYGHDRKNQREKTISSLIELGFEVYVVKDDLSNSAHSIESLLEREGLSLTQLMQSGRVKLVVCLNRSHELKAFRRLLVTNRVTYFTTHEAVERAIESMEECRMDCLTIRKAQSIPLPLAGKNP